MPDELADFLDELNLHIEREIAKAPPPVAEALRRADTGLSTTELLRVLARSDDAADLLERATAGGATGGGTRGRNLLASR